MASMPRTARGALGEQDAVVAARLPLFALLSAALVAFTTAGTPLFAGLEPFPTGGGRRCGGRTGRTVAFLGK